MRYNTICTVALILLVSMGSAWGAGAVLGLLAKPKVMDTNATPDDALPAFLPYTERDDGSSSVIRAGEPVTIRLYENPAAGYRWTVTPSSGFRVIGDYFISADPAGSVTDAGGWRHITMIPELPGTGSVTAVYKRPWEPDTGSGRGYALSFTIR
ncbi:protease inhibitor I42 family protein [Methanoregula sp.]|jgi:inhibitor of cysteine peptidase|uniref:protease inhibitor I42 family protein n=1 Tax=Methanoregula sp. TaxID=2052170 RepID=UPI003C72A5A1